MLVGTAFKGFKCAQKKVKQKNRIQKLFKKNQKRIWSIK